MSSSEELHPHERPFDPGLQTERTLLAWRRTCLSLAAGNTIAIRYLSDVLGSWATLVGVAGLALSLVGWVMATIRYRKAHFGLVRHAKLLTDGKLPMMIAASVLAACLSGIALLFVFWGTW